MLANVVPSAVSNWRKRHRDFPQAWGAWACGELWRYDDVRQWLGESRGIIVNARE